ncbi:MAG: 50S ribosomal protein L22 [Candidatus Roizmanbacteria bacterium GW2011_GWA2_36_23]|uniref:50S ribosomal protein L22 n=1 Tax=Candidatus Roizmanbacteria bacterium GW2011_GWA2_36_23 TaxID=1618480 RepID=A0A0G0E5F3_9BACT|nr:MAG: 50S ribosomal protein L22 [Candidatus Roizmanbacteria bacterium GW2011_GWA2_36_23]
MESRTYLKNLRISPKKLRFYLPAIKKLIPQQAIEHLFYVNQKAGRILYNALKSAINNAQNTLKVQPDLLKFKLLTIEEGQKIKKYQPGGRGTVKPIMKRYSHIKIIIESSEQANEAKTVKVEKAEVKNKITKSKVSPKGRSASGRKSKQ